MINLLKAVKFGIALASRVEDMVKAGKTAKEVLAVLAAGKKALAEMRAQKRGPTKAERDLLNASVKLHSERLG